MTLQADVKHIEMQVNLKAVWKNQDCLWKCCLNFNTRSLWTSPCRWRKGYLSFVFCLSRMSTKEKHKCHGKRTWKRNEFHRFDSHEKKSSNTVICQSEIEKLSSRFLTTWDTLELPHGVSFILRFKQFLQAWLLFWDVLKNSFPNRIHWIVDIVKNTLLLALKKKTLFSIWDHLNWKQKTWGGSWRSFKSMNFLIGLLLNPTL